MIVWVCSTTKKELCCVIIVIPTHCHFQITMFVILYCLWTLAHVVSNVSWDIQTRPVWHVLCWTKYRGHPKCGLNQLEDWHKHNDVASEPSFSTGMCELWVFCHSWPHCVCEQSYKTTVANLLQHHCCVTVKSVASCSSFLGLDALTMLHTVKTFLSWSHNWGCTTFTTCGVSCDTQQHGVVTCKCVSSDLIVQWNTFVWLFHRSSTIGTNCWFCHESLTRPKFWIDCLPLSFSLIFGQAFLSIQSLVSTQSTFHSTTSLFTVSACVFRHTHLILDCLLLLDSQALETHFSFVPLTLHIAPGTKQAPIIPFVNPKIDLVS